MSDKKHIDRIFQEKLKDLEATPSPEVWKNIQSKLEQPKRETERVFPIWLRLSGVAALLLVLLTVGNLINSNFNNTTETNVVDTKNEINNTLEDENKDSNTFNIDNTVAEENSNTSIEKENLNKSLKTSEEKNSSIANSNTSTILLNNKNSDSKKLLNKKYTNVVGNTNFNANNKNTLVATKNNSSIDSNSKRETTNNTAYKNNNTVVANTTSSKNTLKQQTQNNNNLLKENINEENIKSTNKNSGVIATVDANKVNTELTNNTTNNLAENNSEKEENITTDAETKKDETSIEEEIAKAEDLIEKEKKVNRWQVYANAAPVYYNTLGKGSHIDDQFVNNSKSGETNMSYGVNVSYAFNEKLKLRSGVNSLNLSYDTDNVILYENVSGGNSATLKNVSFNNNQAVSAISATNLGVQEAIGILPNENAAISQRLGYYEIPLELEYTISNKKFGVNVIAGMSTFVLNDNKIYSEFEGRKTEIGEANNVNDVSLSGNLGLGLDYKFSDKVKVNVQPTFKYQMNAYENTSGNFRPYIIGVYTGLSYKF